MEKIQEKNFPLEIERLQEENKKIKRDFQDKIFKCEQIIKLLNIENATYKKLLDKKDRILVQQKI